MLEVEREAIVADVTAQSQHLIAAELDALLNFMNSLSTSAAVFVGFSLWVYETPMSDASIGSSNGRSFWVSLYYVFACISMCAYIVVCVTATLVSSSAATYGLTSDNPQAVRQAVLMVRQDRKIVLVAFGLGVSFMLLALAVEYGSHVGSSTFQVATNLTAIFCTFMALGIITWRTNQRYHYDGKTSALLSGDAFLRMGPADAAAAAAAARTTTAREQTPLVS